MDRRDELEFGGTGCLYALLTWWVPFFLILSLAGILSFVGLPGDLIVYGGLVVLTLWLMVRRYRR